MAVPYGHLGVGQQLGHRSRRFPRHLEHQGWGPVGGVLGAHHPYTVDLVEAVQQTGEPLRLMGGDLLQAYVQQEASCGVNPGQALPRRGAVLEAPRPGVGRRSNLVGRQGFEQAGLHPHNPGVRAVPLVRRGGEDVTAQGAHVDGPVRGQVHAVNHHPGAGGVGGRRDSRRIGDGAHGIGRTGDGDPPGGRPYQVDHRLDWEATGRGVEPGHTHLGPRVPGQKQPRRHIRVVVQCRADHLVARSQVAGYGPGQGHHVGRRAGAEHHARRIGAQQPTHRGAGPLGQGVAGRRSGEGPMGVGVVAAPLPVSCRFDGRVHHLGPGRAVETGPVTWNTGKSVADVVEVAHRRAR